MSNKQNDIIAENQLDQDYDKKFLLIELEKELATLLTAFYIKSIKGEGKLTESMDKIINLFRKYGGKI